MVVIRAFRTTMLAPRASLGAHFAIGMRRLAGLGPAVWEDMVAPIARGLPVIGSILRHDSKVTSYKIALLRAINDVALSFADLERTGRDVAVPLRVLAEYWVAYYWPFVGVADPIAQGTGSVRNGQQRSDISFRNSLTELRTQYEGFAGTTGAGRPSDGFVLIHDLRLHRRQREYPQALLSGYGKALQVVCTAIRMPIRYAHGGSESVFPRPARYAQLGDTVVAVPGTSTGDTCLTISHELWSAFQSMSLWIDALCIYEWCMFTDRLPQARWRHADRGEVFDLLTDQPEDRRGLTWERAQIRAMLLAGEEFACPWTGRRIDSSTEEYDLDHFLPVSVYPINELWNLLPSDHRFNCHVKRSRLPSHDRLTRARAGIESIYRQYMRSEVLSKTLREDAAVRFATVQQDDPDFPRRLAEAAVDFVEQVAESRNLARFG